MGNRAGYGRHLLGRNELDVLLAALGSTDHRYRIGFHHDLDTQTILLATSSAASSDLAITASAPSIGCLGAKAQCNEVRLDLARRISQQLAGIDLSMLPRLRGGHKRDSQQPAGYRKLPDSLGIFSAFSATASPTASPSDSQAATAAGSAAGLRIPVTPPSPPGKGQGKGVWSTPGSPIEDLRSGAEQTTSAATTADELPTLENDNKTSEIAQEPQPQPPCQKPDHAATQQQQPQPGSQAPTAEGSRAPVPPLAAVYDEQAAVIESTATAAAAAPAQAPDADEPPAAAEASSTRTISPSPLTLPPSSGKAKKPAKSSKARGTKATKGIKYPQSVEPCTPSPHKDATADDEEAPAPKRRRRKLAAAHSEGTGGETARDEQPQPCPVEQPPRPSFPPRATLRELESAHREAARARKIANRREKKILRLARALVEHPAGEIDTTDI
jgi:hypothetical protein